MVAFALRSIVMEYADAGDLEQKITEHRNRGQYFKENEIWDLFGQMLCGLARLHDLGILHRDVKVSMPLARAPTST